MRKLVYAVAALSLGAVAACNGSADKAQGGDFTLTVPVGADANGHMVYLTNYDTDARIDSTTVVDGVAVFNSHVDTVYMGRLMMDGRRLGMVAIEPGTISIDSVSRKATGTPINDNMAAYSAAQDSIMSEYRAIAHNETLSDSAREAAGEVAQQRLTALDEAASTENAGNPFGMYLFISKAYELDLAQMDSAIAANPTYGESKRIQKLRNGLITKEATSAGKKFVDFEVEYNGETQRLSDHVGKGHFTLVDFWASWCGPCIREAETIKKIYADHKGDDNFEVLGVAVWDEPQNTLKAIEDHGYPWAQIINSQNIATDAYGIPSIPCIILFDPEGTIVNRGLRGEELEASVTEALNNWKK